MSGGSWEYLYARVNEAAERLQGDRNLARRAFGRHLLVVAAALKAIEWVDSGDRSAPEDELAIAAVLSPALMAKEAASELREVTNTALAALNKLEAQ
jgi:hypothetical protein